MSRGNQKPDDFDSRVVDRWDQEDADGVDGFARYCPTCKCDYPPAEDAAHTGH